MDEIAARTTTTDFATLQPKAPLRRRPAVSCGMGVSTLPELPEAGRRTITTGGGRRLAGLLPRLLRDESGAEVLEYVLIAGLIIMATVAVIGSFGAKVLARWTSVSDSSL